MSSSQSNIVPSSTGDVASDDPTVADAIRTVMAAGYVVLTAAQAGRKATTQAAGDWVSHEEIRDWFAGLVVGDRVMTREEIANAMGKSVGLVATVTAQRDDPADGSRTHWSRATWEAHKVEIERERQALDALAKMIG